MKFNEDNAFYYDNEHMDIIYFLIDENDEVVYVGQSTVGLARPYSHRDKDFCKVAIMDCEDYMLDTVESEFILKYQPKYNRNVGIGKDSLKKARDIIREVTPYKEFTLTHLKLLIQLMNIEVSVFGTICYISSPDIRKICQLLRTMYKHYKGHKYISTDRIYEYFEIINAKGENDYDE